MFPTFTEESSQKRGQFEAKIGNAAASYRPKDMNFQTWANMLYLYFRVMGLLHLLFLGEVIKEFIMWSTTTRFFIMYLCSVDLAISLLILRTIKHDVHLLQNSYISAIVVRYVLLRVFIMDLYLVKRKLLRYQETKSFLL